MKNNKGFMLLETLVAAVFILGTLIYIYIQFSSINRSYETSFKYNTITGLYYAKEMASFLIQDGYTTIDDKLTNSTEGFVDITDCTTYSSSTLCKKIVKNIKAKKILYVNENISTLQNNLSISNYNRDIFSEGFKKFILQLNTVEPNGKNRLIIEFKDNTYATINLEEDSTQKYQIVDLIKNGDFENGITSWTYNGILTNDPNKYSGNYSGKFTSNNTTLKNIQQTVKLTKNHIYYASEKIYLSNSSTKDLEFDLYRVGGTINGYPEYGNIDLKELQAKTWNNLSFVFTSSVTYNYNIRPVYFSEVNDAYIDDVMLIDLTETFGSGNEPDKDWCDTHIVQGTTIVYK